MAMNKKEKAAMDAAIARANMLAALRWTAAVPPDVPPPSTMDLGRRLSTGFVAYADNYGPPRVVPACSSSISHALGSHTKTSTQNPRALWSTPLLALRAARHQYEVECAKALAKFDAEIAKHEQEST